MPMGYGYGENYRNQIERNLEGTSKIPVRNCDWVRTGNEQNRNMKGILLFVGPDS